MRPWELERYTLSEYLNAIKGLSIQNAEAWGRARLIAYWSVLPHKAKGSKLKLTDIMEIPLLDGVSKSESQQVGKVYKLSPEEIEQFHAGTWVPQDELKNDYSTVA